MPQSENKFQFPLLVQGEGEGEVTRSRRSSGDCKPQRRWPAWSKWFLKRHMPPLPNPPLGQGEGVRRILPTDSTAPVRRFMADEFAAQIVRRNPLAQGNSYFARTRDHETILALRLRVAEEEPAVADAGGKRAVRGPAARKPRRTRTR